MMKIRTKLVFLLLTFCPISMLISVDFPELGVPMIATLMDLCSESGTSFGSTDSCSSSKIPFPFLSNTLAFSSSGSTLVFSTWTGDSQ